METARSTMGGPAAPAAGGPGRQTAGWLAVTGWLAVAGCLLYGGFAFAVAIDSVLAALRPGGTLDRSAPPLFVAHAVTGGVALTAGAIQLRLAGRLVRTRRGVHRRIGWLYVCAAWATSLASLGVAASFDVGVAGRVALGLGSLLWFTATTVAFGQIRAGRADRHREWMIRSYALAFFFVTFSLWVPLFASTSIPDSVGYPVAVLLSWGLNLAAAEVWIRRTRRPAAGQRAAPSSWRRTVSR